MSKFSKGTQVNRTSTPAPSTTKHANSAYKGGKKSGAAAAINNKK